MGTPQAQLRWTLHCTLLMFMDLQVPSLLATNLREQRNVIIMRCTGRVPVLAP